MTNEQRGNLYLLTGLVLGLALGLLIAWVISPLKYTDTDPGALAAPYKAEYRRMIALAYQRGRNLDRARQRLNLLGDDDPVQVLAAEAQRMLAEDQASQEARALAILAADLNRPISPLPSPTAPAVAQSTEETVEATATLPQGQAIRSPTPLPPTRTPTPFISPTPTRTRIPTFAPRATATPVPAQTALYELKSKQPVCNGTLPDGLMQIEVTDAKGQPQAAVKVTITWNQGEDVFYTGLAPEISPGYADFLMLPGGSYSIKVGEISDAISGIDYQEGCGWRIVVDQAGS